MSGADRRARRLYSALWWLALPLALARLLWRGRVQPAYRHRLGERLASRRSHTPRADIWIHAVSVGEVQAAESLLRQLLATTPAPSLLVTTTTPTGAERLRALFGDTIPQRYLPFDLPVMMGRLVDAVQPKLVIILETEIWPNLLAVLEQRAIPVALINARLSERSARGYARLGSLTRSALARLTLIAAQATADAERFIALGAPPERVIVTGNLKFDQPQAADLAARAAAIRQDWGAARPVWIAASTHAGEELQVLEAHQQVLAQWPEALLVLVPRHPERFETVAALIARQGFALTRRSAERAIAAQETVYLGDRMGELPLWLAASDVAFIGGSLVPTGGHNPLEAAASGVPILVGPHTFNFATITAWLLDAHAALRISDAATLSDAVRTLFASSKRRAEMGAHGRAVVAAQRGALQRVFIALAPWLAAAVQAPLNNDQTSRNCASVESPSHSNPTDSVQTT